MIAMPRHGLDTAAVQVWIFRITNGFARARAGSDNFPTRAGLADLAAKPAPQGIEAPAAKSAKPAPVVKLSDPARARAKPFVIRKIHH